MGCGCSGQPQARRPVRNMVKSPTEGVLSAVASNRGAAPSESKDMTAERRKIEKLRRDAILRALGRP